LSIGDNRKLLTIKVTLDQNKEHSKTIRSIISIAIKMETKTENKIEINNINKENQETSPQITDSEESNSLKL
jgi:hypothetical protein